MFKLKLIKTLSVIIAVLLLLSQAVIFAETPPSYHSVKGFEELMDWIRNTEAGNTDAWGSMDSFINAAREQKNILTVKSKNENCVLDEILVTSNHKIMEYFFTVDGKRFEVVIELPSAEGDKTLKERIEALNEKFKNEYEGLVYTESSAEIDGEEVKIYYYDGGSYPNKTTGESELLAPQATFEIFDCCVKLIGIADLYGTDWDSSYFNCLKFEFGVENVDFNVMNGPVFAPVYKWINPFDDVKDGWYYGDVKYAYVNGIMNGTGVGTFSPDMTLTRGMLVTVLYRMAGSPPVEAQPDSGDLPFQDVKQHEWYTDAVEWAYYRGIINGTSASTFAPDVPVTRQDLAVVLHRYIKKVLHEDISCYSGIKQFADDALVADYAKDAVKELRDIGIINGKSGNVFDPLGYAARAEVAALLHRFAEMER